MHYFGLEYALFYARVFSEMENKVRSLWNTRFDILGMPFPVLDAFDVIFFRAGKVVIERDDRMPVPHEPLAQMGANEAGASGDEYEFAHSLPRIG